MTSSRKKNAVTVLGATGSIGDSTLDIIAQHSDKFDLFAVSGNQRIDKLAEICRRFKPIYAVQWIVLLPSVWKNELNSIL